MKSFAVFSDCEKYRYTLRRDLADNQRTCLFIMLNPSTADAVQDDPTVRRCIGYAKRWGFGKLIVCNIFAFRSTDPDVLFEVEDPIGAHNIAYIRQAIVETITSGGKVVCAWGANGSYLNQGNRVVQLIKRIGTQPFCLKTNKDGQPAHPLYLRGNLEPKVLDNL